MRICQHISNPVTIKEGVHFIRDANDFNYSDGDSTEGFILDIIKNAKDISCYSRELASHIKDWPTRYHFSRERSLAYRPLKITQQDKILEVGCGCGSVTRYLGEEGGYLLALEGSARRAQITRSRTRDLEHVDVLCASFEEVQFTTQFDLVICNGVVEYARLFIQDEEPFIKMLESLSKLVAPGGLLIVAIENQFGLRYFSSGKEEHTGVMYDGLEGYAAKPNGPETFGRRAWMEMLGRFFPSVELLLPLPDYKLPVAVIRSELTEKVNPAELFACTTGFKFGSQVVPQMHERLVWHALHKNHSIPDFANAFFLLAGNQKSRFLDSDWMGSIYTINRHPGLAVQTRIYVGENGKIETCKSYFDPETPKRESALFAHQVGSAPWEAGVSVHTTIVRAFRNGKKIPLEERIQTPVQIWWQAIQQEGKEAGLLSGKALDYSWKNILIHRGEGAVIDKEWILRGGLEPSWLIYRTVTLFITDELNTLHRWSMRCRRYSHYDILMAVAKIVGEPLTISSIVRAMDREADLQAFVTGGTGSRGKVFKKLWVMFMPISWRVWRKSVSRSLKKWTKK